MRYLKIPETIQQRNLTTKEEREEISFFQFFSNILTGDRRWGKSVKTLRSHNKIYSAIDGVKPGTVVALHENDWELLKQVADEPQLGCARCSGPLEGYGSGAFMQVIPFIEAILNASDVDPAEVEKL